MSEIAADHFERWLEGPMDDDLDGWWTDYRPRRRPLKAEEEFEDLETSKEVK